MEDEEKKLLESLQGGNESVTYHLTSFPTEMSCSQAFDELYQCYSVGGQFRNIYRNGEMNACKDKRAKMLFCLRAKLDDVETQKVKIAQFYKEQLARKKATHGSSEDVWTRRTTPLSKPFLEE
ncbi:hypothetical protein TRVA0_016S01046 [Trichomonascus vanleenenianus]|uniref:Emi1p n=1 Tax=Trichomonascus vanleenenianus TaxID=2268995 RepID=UPI003EC99DC9